MPTRGGTCTKPCFNQQPWEMPVSPLPLPGLLYSTQMQEHPFPLGGDTLYICFTCSWAAVVQALTALQTRAPTQDGPLPIPGGSLLLAASTLIIACDPESGVTAVSREHGHAVGVVMSPAQHSCVVHVLGGRWELRDVTSLSTLSYHQSRSPVARIFL